MANVIEERISSLVADCNLLVCADHVVNLAAGEGLKALGYMPQEHVVSQEKEKQPNLDSGWGYGELNCEEEIEFDLRFTRILHQIRTRLTPKNYFMI